LILAKGYGYADVDKRNCVLANETPISSWIGKQTFRLDGGDATGRTGQTGP
jgi:hypothetical protein